MASRCARIPASRISPGQGRPPRDILWEDARKMLWRFGDRCQFVDAANDLIAERRMLWPGVWLLHLTHAFHRTWVNGSCIIIDQQCALKKAPGWGPMSKS
jgi:hypothetical protein